MDYRVIFLALICLIAASAESRRPPNYELIEQLFKDTSDTGRLSNNLLEDASLDVPDLIRKYGYPAEVHEVVTEDGYILEVHRIPYGRDANNQPDPDKPVVLVVHGLATSSADWVVMGPGTSLGYALADSGFDVWLANVRGNFYSLKHTTLNPAKDIAYWDFTWEHFGSYDVPAMIDYILGITGKQRLHYIGHSQGTTTFFAMGSLRPEYNDKIITMQAYAPVAYLKYNANPVFKMLAPYSSIIVALTNRLGIGGIMHRPKIVSTLGRVFCGDDRSTQKLCSAAIQLIAGVSGSDMFNVTMLPVKLAHAPAGIGLKQLAHYGQLIGRDYFRRYDHGPISNLREYGRLSPPRYELEKVTAPVYFHYAEKDVFADLQDVNRLWNEIGNPVQRIRVEREPFSHLDFSWGQNAKEVVYDKTIDIMKQFPNN